MDKQELKLGARILENLPTMSSDVMQGWIDNPKSLKEFLSGLVLEEAKKPYLRHLQTITLRATNREITLAQASNLFTGYLDTNFKNWGTDVVGEDTIATKVNIHEIVRSSKFQTLFGSLGDPHKLCLTQGQIVEFCRTHFNPLYSTFFLFEVNDELFVARVYVYDCKLRAIVHRFESSIVRFAIDRPRMVVKKQTV